jgi:hypothetical protein
MLRAVKPRAHPCLGVLFAGCIVQLPFADVSNRFDFRAGAGRPIVMVEVQIHAVQRLPRPLTADRARYTEDRRDNFDILRCRCWLGALPQSNLW